jgi:hypothetical protein
MQDSKLPKRKEMPQYMVIKSYSKSELCELYQISYKTLRRWLKAHDDYLGKDTRIFDAAKVEFIFEKFGYPKYIEF